MMEQQEWGEVEEEEVEAKNKMAKISSLREEATSHDALLPLLAPP